MFFKKKDAALDYIVVGLGNPGKQYENSRHNVGFRMLDALAEQCGVKVTRAKFQALTGTGRIGGARVLLMKPTTFMNLSGDAVKAAADYYKLPAERIVVIFDDISLEPGHIRIRADGSAGGHNGLKSLITRLGSDRFSRIKVGVGAKPRPDLDLADWVLAAPSAADKKKIAARTDDVLAAAALLCSDKLALAQNQFNG